jgi:hypothetical protein
MSYKLNDSVINIDTTDKDTVLKIVKEFKLEHQSCTCTANFYLN